MSKYIEEVIQEFRDKKQDLKDWLYGTVHKRYDREEEAEIVQQDVENFFTDEWFENVIQSALQKQIEMIEGQIMYCIGKNDPGRGKETSPKYWGNTLRKEMQSILNQYK